jgi:hypothetical protein
LVAAMQASVVLRKAVQIIVMVSVTEETPYLISGLLSGVTVMTVIYGPILDRVRSSTS